MQVAQHNGSDEQCDYSKSVGHLLRDCTTLKENNTGIGLITTFSLNEINSRFAMEWEADKCADSETANKTGARSTRRLHTATRSPSFNLAQRLTTEALVAPLSCAIMLSSVRVNLFQDATPTSWASRSPNRKFQHKRRTSGRLVQRVNQLGYLAASPAISLAVRSSWVRKGQSGEFRDASPGVWRQ